MGITKEERAQLIGLKDATALVRGRHGKNACVATLRAWATRGYRLPDGRIVLLRTVRDATDFLTTPQWCAEFEETRFEPTPAPRGAVLARSAKQRARDHARAERELDEMGCK